MINNTVKNVSKGVARLEAEFGMHQSYESLYNAGAVADQEHSQGGNSPYLHFLSWFLDITKKIER